jgi:hypothetical protein
MKRRYHQAFLFSILILLALSISELCSIIIIVLFGDISHDFSFALVISVFASIFSIIAGDLLGSKIVQTSSELHSQHALKLADDLRSYIDHTYLFMRDSHWSPEREIQYLANYNIPNEKKSLDYWTEIIAHLKSGKDYKEAFDTYTLLDSNIEEENAVTKEIAVKIDSMVESAIKSHYPNVPLDASDGQFKTYFMKDNLAHYAIRFMENTLPTPLSKADTVNPIPQPGDGFIDIRIDDMLLARFISKDQNEIQADIAKIRDTICLVISNQELLKLMVERNQIKINSDLNFNRLKTELKEIIKKIESSQDIDGSCENCPRF